MIFHRVEVSFLWDRSAEDRRVGGAGPHREAWWYSSRLPETNCKTIRKKGAGFIFPDPARTYSCQYGLWRICELKGQGLKVVTGGIIDAPCRQEDPHLGPWRFFHGRREGSWTPRRTKRWRVGSVLNKTEGSVNEKGRFCNWKCIFTCFLKIIGACGMVKMSQRADLQDRDKLWFFPPQIAVNTRSCFPSQTNKHKTGCRTKDISVHKDPRTLALIFSFSCLEKRNTSSFNKPGTSRPLLNSQRKVVHFLLCLSFLSQASF